MSRFSSFRDVIDLWPTRDALAVEIGASIAQARKWPFRDNIPAEWWLKVLKSKTAQAAGVTVDDLMRLAARRLP